MMPVLEVLAKEFRSRRAGRTANATRDIIIPFNDLLKKASSLHGPPRTEALREGAKLSRISFREGLGTSSVGWLTQILGIRSFSSGGSNPSKRVWYPPRKFNSIHRLR